MFAKIIITRSGYDPERGKHIKDPYLGGSPSIGACRPDVRKRIEVGGQLFFISGMVADLPQVVLGGFEVAEKISMIDAYHRFPEQRLKARADGQLEGNVIINRRGEQHPLDDHKNFSKRVQDYVVGKNPIVLATPRELALGREQTLQALQEILKKKGRRPIDIVGRWGRDLTEEEAEQLRRWLLSIKSSAA
jgi:hypothetical protein